MLNETSAIFMILFAAFLWGSWLQATKYTGGFPLPAFMLWLYGASFVLVWVFILVSQLFSPQSILGGIGDSPALALFVLLCGALMAVGIQLQMRVVDRVGLVLSNSVSATCGVLLGTAVTALVGGLPESFSLLSVFAVALVLILATLVCQYSGKLRDRDLSRKASRPAVTQDNKAAALLVISSVLVAFYPLGMSLGVKTNFSATGFSSYGCIGLLSAGSFLGTLVYSGYYLTRDKQWGAVFNPKYKKAIALSCLSGFCHYGGNLIHVMAAPVISVAVSWLIGRSANMWTYLWGIYHKEYKGASRKTYAVLGVGIAIYIAGILLLAKNLYV